MRQRSQLLQALGDRTSKAVLARHVRVQQYVLGRLSLIAAVGAPQLLHLQSLSDKVCQVYLLHNYLYPPSERHECPALKWFYMVTLAVKCLWTSAARMAALAC